MIDKLDFINVINDEITGGLRINIGTLMDINNQ